MESERRSEILAAVHRVRNRRVELLAAVEAGNPGLGDVFDMAADDDVVASTKLAAVLVALPGMGQVSTKRLLAGLGVDDGMRIGELSSAEKGALLTALS